MTRRSRRILIVAVVLAVLGGAGAFVAFGIFGVHTLVVDDKVAESAPATASEVIARGTWQPADKGAAGTVALLGTPGAPSRFLRFEEGFRVDNGPDLFVYLGTGSGRYDDPGEYVALGQLKGNIGTQNYELPAGVDLSRFTTVAVWCKRFDSTFAVATLATV